MAFIIKKQTLKLSHISVSNSVQESTVKQEANNQLGVLLTPPAQ